MLLPLTEELGDESFTEEMTGRVEGWRIKLVCGYDGTEVRCSYSFLPHVEKDLTLKRQLLAQRRKVRKEIQILL